MTTRDRLVILTLAALAVLAAVWLVLVSPERKQAAQAKAQVEGIRQQLQSAQSKASEARTAQAKYANAYASVVQLGEAVPAETEVPSLIYQLDQLSNQRFVDFSSISTGTGGPNSSGPSSGSSSSTSSTSTTSAAGTATQAPTTFTRMPFTFVFKGSFFRLYHLLHQIDGFAQRTASGSVRVSGRLVTIQGLDLTLENQNGAGASNVSSGALSATITATAYVLPANQGLTGGATAEGPAGAGATETTAAASSSSTPATPAVVRSAP